MKKIIPILLLLTMFFICGCDKNSENTKYTITFNTNGGSIIEPITQDFDTSINPPKNPTREGYTFAGWDQEFPSKMPSNNIELKANWQINQYTISFNPNGGSNIDPITQDFNTVVNAPNNPTKEGYSFAGWDQEFPSKMPSNNIELKANWQINQYTISFNPNGGSTIEPITQDFNSVVNAPDNPTKEGYSFAGWDQEFPSKMPSNNIELKANWQINQYTISFNPNGGSTIEPITQDFNSVVNAPDNPTKEGYTFDGWDPVMPSKMPAGNLILIAQWKVNQYTITFNSNGGSPVDPITQDYGSTVTPPTDPTKERYKFIGWEPQIPSEMPAENITLIAQWESIQYTISFNSNGGSEVPSITQDYGTKIEAPNIPTKQGYSFFGWDKVLPLNMPAEDIHLTAIWLSETHDTFLFGEYPQSVVTNNDLINHLNSLTTTNSKGYYEYEGNQYAKLISSSYGEPTFLNGQTIKIYDSNYRPVVYYFKIEPIKWRIIENSDGILTLIADMILDNQVFYTSTSFYTPKRIIDGVTISHNNYEYSTIREWLNNDFYNLAFNDDIRDKIQTTLNDNKWPGECGVADTLDKVYLLKSDDLAFYNETYGLNSNPLRQGIATDYAKTKGLEVIGGYSYWWTRTASNYAYYDESYIVSSSGVVQYKPVDMARFSGVRPVIRIVL